MKGWRRGSKRWFLFLALLVFLAVGCGGDQANLSKARGLLKEGAAGAPSDIVLITIDTWRHDAWGTGGPVNTPNLDLLAAQGVRFENAFAHAVVTLPSHASILTGLYPYQHGLRDNAGFRLDTRHRTLAHYLKEQEYRTGAFVSAFPLDSRYGLHDGFEHYDDYFDSGQGNGVSVPERSGRETMDRALSWMKQIEGQKKFVWIHIYEPHYPYQPPEPFKSEYPDSPYHGEVAYSDSLIRPLIAYLKDKDAVVAITSDHGESLGEHGELTHGVFAYNATLKIPLLFWSPNRLNPGKIDALARHIDLFPTLLALSGFEPPGDVPGQYLFGRDFREEPAYFESLTTFLNRSWAPLRGCLDGEVKAIQLPIPELYNLRQDPDEKNNLVAGDPGAVSAFLACLPDEAGLGSNRGSISPDEMAKLQALGYATASSEGDGDHSDPKLLMDTDRKFHEALARFGSGDRQGGIEDLESLTRIQPQMAVAYFYLADFYDRLQQPDRAIETMKRAFANGVRSETAIRKLALLLTEKGETGEALLLLQSFEQTEDPETHAAFGKIFARQGRLADADRAFRRSLDLDSDNPKVLAEWGTLKLFAKMPDQAKPLFEKALSINKKQADAWNGLGVVLAGERDVEGAIHAWETAIQYDPGLSFAYWNLAGFYERTGRTDLAVARLESFVRITTGKDREKGLDKLKKLKGQ